MPELPEVPELPEGEHAGDGPEESTARPAATDDELFAQLIAGFDDPVDEGSRTWPEAEDVADLGDLAPSPRPRPAIIRLPVVQAIPPVDPRSWTPAEDPDDDHFVPPPPPPLPRTAAQTRLAVAALIGGLVLVSLYMSGQIQGMGGILGAAMFLGGAGTLVARLKVDDEDEDDDDPDNGAVV